jgi:hypothetical protein
MVRNSICTPRWSKEELVGHTGVREGVDVTSRMKAVYILRASA